MENSKIEWTSHTFNSWHGCMKVSPACKHCYAEGQDKRWNKEDARHWGPMSERKPMSEEYWRKPIKWNAEAEKSGEITRVFCASMADWAERNDTIHHLPSWLNVQQWRIRLFNLIRLTPHLTWQLLTKRPQHILKNIQDAFYQMDDFFIRECGPEYIETRKMLLNWLDGNPPANVHLGTSIGTQDEVQNIAHLLQVPAALHFLSLEPLLESLDLSKVDMMDGSEVNPLTGKIYGYEDAWQAERIGWVIVGGESGHHARPMHPDWARSIRDQCKAAAVPFFFKQWGEYAPVGIDCPVASISNTSAFMDLATRTKIAIAKVGKQEAGATLDGVSYKNFPKEP